MRTRQRLTLPFPSKGLHQGLARRAQPEGTSSDLQNVRAYDPATGRSRGAQRGGLSKYLSAQHDGADRIQDISHVVSVTVTPAQMSQHSLRSVVPVAVSSGRVRSFDSSSFTTPLNYRSVRTFNRSVPEYFSVADHADFSTGDIDFTWAAWVYFDVDDVHQHIVAKMTSPNWEYDLRRNTANAFFWRINASGSINIETDVYSSGIWYWVVASHDATGNTLDLEIWYGEETDTYSVATGGTAPVDLTSDLRVGSSNETSSLELDGSMSYLGFWKRLLTTAEKNWLYNEGVGRPYAEIGVASTDGSALKTSLMAYYDMDEASGNALDSHTSGHDLTDNGTVGSDAGDVHDLSTTAPVIFSTPFFGDLYYADGNNERYYDSSVGQVSAWTASAGSLPSNAGNRPRLIETWRGRLVLSGISSDPHNWFMSAYGDATDFDYAPEVEVETQAVAGNNSEAGLVGDVINGMIPYTDDILIFGCDHSIWQMTGDPMAGGRIDMVSDITGMAWGRAWCKDPFGNIYFFGSRGGIYRLVPGQPPARITGLSIDESLATVNLDTSIVRMVWSDREIGLYCFITPLTAGSTSHYFYDVRNEAFFKDVFANNNHNPVSVHILDGDAASDRVILLGGEDGYIRKIDLAADDDDGTAISSHVVLGPIQIQEGQTPFVISGLQAVLDDGSDDVAWELYSGSSAEGIASSAERSGSFSATRSYRDNPRIRAYAAELKLKNTTNDEKWAMENVFVDLDVIETSRGRTW